MSITDFNALADYAEEISRIPFVDGTCHPTPANMAKIAVALREASQLESQHEDLVDRNAFLRERPDLPVDRISAYLRLSTKIAALEKQLEKKS